jgi:hypothetical protein
LFDTAISFRLSQLKDAWRALHNAEARLKTPLPEVCALLTAMPVSEQQSRDEDYLRQLDNKDRAEQLMMEWQLFPGTTAAGDRQAGEPEMRLPGFIRNLTISASLRGAFLTGRAADARRQRCQPLFLARTELANSLCAQRLFPADSDLVPD